MVKEEIPGWGRMIGVILGLFLLFASWAYISEGKQMLGIFAGILAVFLLGVVYKGKTVQYMFLSKFD